MTLGNRILDALPDASRDRLMRSQHMHPTPEPLGRVLREAGQPVTRIYFPIDAVVSLVTPTGHGEIVEVATVGKEGIVGVPAVLTHGPLMIRSVVQVAGSVYEFDRAAFDAERRLDKALDLLVSSYIPALLGQIAQAAACNRLHTNEERLARWLLFTQDRVGRDGFPITHEFLGQMLGVSRQAVSISAAILQRAGFIHYRYGHVQIIDREGLEYASCECYRVIKRELDQVVRRVSGTDPSLHIA